MLLAEQEIGTLAQCNLDMMSAEENSLLDQEIMSTSMDSQGYLLGFPP